MRLGMGLSLIHISIRPPGTVRVQSIGPESTPPSRRQVAGETCADAAQLTHVTGSGLKCRTLLVFISRFSTSASPGTGPMGSVLFTPEWVMALSLIHI